MRRRPARHCVAHTPASALTPPNGLLRDRHTTHCGETEDGQPTRLGREVRPLDEPRSGLVESHRVR